MRIISLLFFALIIEALSAQNCLLFEDFAGSSPANPPAGWTIGPGTNIGNSFPANPTLDPAVGFNNVGEFAATPIMTCPDSVCFLWHASGQSSNYQVEISWTQDPNLLIWNPIDTILLTGSGSPTTYQELCVDIPNALLTAPFDVSIKWEMIARSSGTFYLENVCVKGPGVCTVVPTQLSINTSVACKSVNTPFTIEVCATDANGFIDETYGEEISLAVMNGPGNLTGITTGLPVNGCFQFTVGLDMEGTHVIEAMTASLSGTSGALNIVDVCPMLDTLRVMAYNLLNYPDGRDDCDSNTVVLSRWDTLQKIVQYWKPDILMVCELQTENGANLILSDALNQNGVIHYSAANFVPNQSTIVTTLNNMFYYNSNKVTMLAQDEILTTTRDINKYTILINDPNLASTGDSTFIDFYMAHLKAGNGSSDSIRRSTDVTIFKAQIDGEINNRNRVFGGDLNFFTASEQAYQTLVGGTYPFLDPGIAGAWDGDCAYAAMHTQSSRPGFLPTWDCGLNGGMDSRFDFLMFSEPVSTGDQKISYLSNTYTPLGNDGNSCNQGVNDPSNMTGLPDSILNALFYMSDHLPVVMELEVEFSAILPLRIISFEATKSGQHVQLDWSATTQGVERFILERSSDGRNYLPIGAVAVDLSATFSSEFQAIDKDPSVGQNYYRIVQVDRDGGRFTSSVRIVLFEKEKYVIIAPNPAQTYFQILSEYDVTMDLSMFDMQGRLILTRSNVSSGSPIDISGLKPGIYSIEINTNTHFTRSRLMIIN